MTSAITKKFVMAGQAQRDPATQGYGHVPMSALLVFDCGAEKRSL